MKIVIDIPERTFKMVNMFGWDNEYNDIFERALENSIVLPKGHGRLIDADKIIKYWKPDHNRQFDADYFIHTLEVADTIIEADKEE